MTMDLGKIEPFVAAILEQEKAELVDLECLRENGRWVLRLFVDKDGGVTLDDCEALSERVGAALDASDVIDRTYVLEISSPGVDRVLKKDRDFERFAGRQVRVVLSAPVEGRRRLVGRLRGLAGGEIVIEAEGREWRLPRREVEEARLDADAELAQDLKRADVKGKGSGRRPVR